MESEDLPGWTALQDSALGQLKEAAPAPRGLRLTARCLVLPSFDDAYAYDVLKSIRGEDAFLTNRTVWRFKADAARFAAPRARRAEEVSTVPTIEVRQVDLKTSAFRVAHALAEVRALSLPLLPPDRSFGIVGVTYEVMFGDLYSSCRYRWWVAPPNGWRALAEFVNEIRKIVDGAIARVDRKVTDPKRS